MICYRQTKFLSVFEEYLTPEEYVYFHFNTIYVNIILQNVSFWCVINNYTVKCIICLFRRICYNLNRFRTDCDSVFGSNLLSGSDVNCSRERIL